MTNNGSNDNSGGRSLREINLSLERKEVMAKASSSIDEAIKRAVKYLPEDAVLVLSVRRGEYSVTLETPTDMSVGGVNGGEGVESDIDAAVKIACTLAD